jgi:hypothetical protein
MVHGECATTSDRARGFLIQYPSLRAVHQAVAAHGIAIFAGLRTLPGMPVRLTWPVDITTAYKAVQAAVQPTGGSLDAAEP